jgi:hypothetical protein
LEGDPSFGPAFTENTSFNLQPGTIDEAGGTTSVDMQNQSELLLFTATFRAAAPGSATWQLHAADVLPDHAVRLVGLTDALTPEQGLFGSTTVQIFLPFTVQNDLFNVDEDTEALLDVLANDFFHGTFTAPLRVIQLGTPSAGGQVEIDPSGQVRYRPAQDFFGIETFTYQVTDGVTGTAEGTVTVQVHPLNDPPTAVDDLFTGSRAIPEDSPAVVLDVLANDSSAPDGPELLRIVAVGPTSHGGTVTIAPARTHVLYQPAPNFFGRETFTYTIDDGNGARATATVTVEVTEVNDPPVAVNDSFTLPEDSPFTRFEPLANDHSGPDPAEELTIVAITPSVTARGTARIIEQGKAIEYQPAPNFFGTDLFTYTIRDERGATTVGQIRFVVTPVNDPPTAVDDTGEQRFRVGKNSRDNSLDVLRNDTANPDVNEVLVIQSVTGGSAGGSLRVAPDLRTVLYTPVLGFSGRETFQYTIVDPGGLTATATAEVEVLDFLPSSLSGVVYVDANGNGQPDAGEMRLPGVRILLTGTDAQGASVSLEAHTGADGSYEFRDLAPGNYVIQQVQPPFFIDGPDTVGSQGGVAENDRLIISLGEGVTGTGNNFAERGREPRLVRATELFASRRRSAAVLMVAKQTGQAVVLESRGLPSISAPQATLAPDGNSWTVSLVVNGQRLTATLPNRPSRYLRPLAVTDSHALLEISGIRQGRVFQVSSAAPSEGESTGVVEQSPAEGEPGANQTAIPMTSANALTQIPKSAGLSGSGSRPMTAVQYAQLVDRVLEQWDGFVRGGAANWLELLTASPRRQRR